MSEKQQTLTLTTEDLRNLISSAVTAAVGEMRKPTPPDEKELADLKQKQEERLATAQSVKEKNENKRFIQEKVCTHEHLASAGGGTHCVFVHDNGVPLSPGYVYCQKCEGRVRPDEPLMRKLDPNAIFDSFLFNKLLQSCIQTGQEIMG